MKKEREWVAYLLQAYNLIVLSNINHIIYLSIMLLFHRCVVTSIVNPVLNTAIASSNTKVFMLSIGYLNHTFFWLIINTYLFNLCLS